MVQGNKPGRAGLRGSKAGGRGEGTISSLYNKLYTFVFPNTKSTEEER